MGVTAAGAAGAGAVIAGPGVEVGTVPATGRSSTIRRSGLANVEAMASTLSPRSSTTRVMPMTVSATRMRRSILPSTASEYMRGPLTMWGVELRMS